MLFNSTEFIFLFLPFTLFIFFQLKKRNFYEVSILWLVAASLFFYGWWNPAYLGLLIFSIIFNYFTGVIIGNSNIKRSRHKTFLAIGILVNLALIGYYKYANFFVFSVNDIVGTEFNLHKIILPLGISFFTFQQIAYLVDAYRGETKEYSFINYCLFVTFFPQLIAGPIVHHKEILPQFKRQELIQFNSEDIAVGLSIFSLGLFKKVMLADRIAPYASPIFSIAAQGGTPTFFEAWGAALAYSLQLYFDFSGYSDMAIGAARMFGIKLPLNFNSPYKAVNIIDFWRRWHITLSRFLKDYLYIPLGGNQHGKGRRYFNLMVTMLLGGLWHGAGWNFIFWGGLHGVYLTLNHQWHSVQKALGKNPNTNSWLSLVLSRFITFLAVVFAWVFFRSENMNTAFAMLSGMIGLNGIVVPTLVISIFPPLKSLLPLLGITVKPIGGVNFISTYFWVFMLLAIAWFTPNTQQWMQLYKPALDYHPEKHSFQWGSYFGKNLFHWKPTLKFGLVIGIIIFLSVKSVVTAAPSEFLYFNF